MTYYAHSVYKYNTEIEKYEMSLIPGDVINPNGIVDQDKSEKEIMLDCYKLIDKCDCLVFSSVDGVLGRGVANEITYAFFRNIPIYYLHSNKLIPIKTITMKSIENSTTQRLYVTFEYEVM
jgi:nucleoside 2-deoxyribosyltransferase